MPRLPRRAALGLAAVAALSLAGCAASGAPDPDGSASPAETFTIAIAEFTTIKPIEENVAAFKAGLADLGYVEGENVEYIEQNAQGQTSAVSLITSQIVDEEPDLIYALGTPMIVSLAQAAPDTPVLFGIMVDPVEAGVLEDVEAPGGMVTGTSSYLPPAVYYDTFETLLPDATRVGYIGNPAEPNTQSELESLQAEADARGLELVFVPVSDSSKIQLALESLVGRVDLVTFTNDNTVSAALESVVKQATALGLPVIASQAESATLGGLAGFGQDWAVSGRVSAEQAAAILSGESRPGDIPVWYVPSDDVQIVVNRTVAEQFGIDTDGLGETVTIID